MQAVILEGWTHGFLTTQLIRLLRENNFALADAHSLASDFVDGQKVSVFFDDRYHAEQFAEKVRQLKVDAAITPAIRAYAG